jgi:hypothetical protein
MNLPKRMNDWDLKEKSKISDSKKKSKIDYNEADDFWNDVEE